MTVYEKAKRLLDLVSWRHGYMSAAEQFEMAALSSPDAAIEYAKEIIAASSGAREDGNG